MKLIVKKYSNTYDGYGYFIGNESFFSQLDESIAQYLNMEIDEYYGILKKYNGYSSREQMGEYCFNNKEDAEECLVYLEPYLIMVELTK